MSLNVAFKSTALVRKIREYPLACVIDDGIGLTAIVLQCLSKPTANQHIFIAGVGHDALGFACMYGGDDELWGSFLNNIHVSRSHQRLGIGAKLLNACACICAERYGNAGLYLWVVQTNEKAQHFYARYGAENLEESTWNSPEGSIVPLYRFVWKDVQRLRSASA